jgi:hypothetical protein
VNSGGYGLLATTFMATGSGNLGSIATVFAQSETLQLSLGLYADSSGKPGQLLESWSLQIPSTTSPYPPITTLTSVVHPFVSSGMTYWFVWSSGNATNSTSWWPNDEGVTGGYWQTAGTNPNLLAHAFPTLPTPGIQLTTQSAGGFSHIAAGAGWTTDITLNNTSIAAVQVTVDLHNDDGSALSLPVTTTQQGSSQTTTTSSVTATINPNATFVISIGDGVASPVVGWAEVDSIAALGGYAVFRSTPQTGSPSEGTVPLQAQFSSTVTLPYDNTNGFVMGVALANLSTSSANVTATVWDASGKEVGLQTMTIAGNGHTSFSLPTQIPTTAGQMGIVRFQSAGTGGLAGIGLRFSPFGTFTSVPTM